VNFDLIIVGGGLAGAAMAVALRRSHLKIALIEQGPPVKPDVWDQRIYAYSPASAAFLAELGVWAHLEHARLTPVSAMQIHGDEGGTLNFTAYESGLSELAWIGESSLVHLELWESLKRQHNVTLFCPGVPEALDAGDSGATVRLKDGRVLSAALVVGADGRDSWARREASIAASVTHYGEMGVVANLRAEWPHRGTAFQWFMPAGVLAWLPLADGMISVVWSASDALASELLALPEDEFCARVAAAGGHRLGRFEMVTPRAAFPLRLMRTATVVRPRIALIGDAAHAIHPLSGHGINLGFQDARVLANALAALPTWRDPGELAVLRAYARRRAEEPFLLQYATHGLSRLFGNDNPLLGALRNAGLNLTSQLPVLKNALVRYAATGRF
jgi:ubiquinone biosynthesis UbiH/UbiF/VisC/COQ6 family hydroxylase